MDELRIRRAAESHNRDDSRRPSLAERPDRVALWAVGLAVVAMVAGVASARAGSSGGIGGGGGGQAEPVAPGCAATEFGRRTLREGDCGNDVETLNWILKAKKHLRAPLADHFEVPTADAVRAFQREAALSSDGIVDGETSSALVRSMPRQLATWYGPGFFGNRTACGQRLTRQTTGVAHRNLPCGSKVVLRYKGRYVRTRIIDRGPFANGAKWDLTQATAMALKFEHTDDLRAAKIPK
jgi:peptidoglycan hydrolase-like protein with peptidoglycan-binding domain